MSLPDLSTIPHNTALEEIVDVLCNKTQNLDRKFFRVVAAFFLTKMASAMRASMITKDRGEIPVNIYALALGPSGSGKNQSITLIEEQFLGPFKERFVEDTFGTLAEQNLWVIANIRAARSGNDQQLEYDKVKQEFEKAGVYPFTFDSGTAPAVKQLRQKLLMAGSGSINLQIDEIGSNLISQTELLNTFLELYDLGLIKQKLTKNTNENMRMKEIDGRTPTNMLLFGVPGKLLDGGKTEDEFYSFLDIGYARRCVFAYGQIQKASQNLTAAEIFHMLTQPANEATITKWSRHFYQLADPAMFNWKMTVDDDVSIALLDYRMECEKLSESLSEYEEIKKPEIAHRYFKALKLAGTYAFMDGSTEILMDHLLQAIKLVEESGVAFQKLLHREKTYMKLARYIAEVGDDVTHADLNEALPFYSRGKSAREEQMLMAISWGYKRHIIIKKSFINGIEFFKGEKLKETDLSKMIISYSGHWAYDYLGEQVPFESLCVITGQPDYHWANHHFIGGHRCDENVIIGFNMIVIDVDGGVDLALAHELMKEYKFMTYTTKRHTDDANRFRMIIPMNYQLYLDQQDYKEFMNSVMEWLPFSTDESANQRAKKWETYEQGQIHYNLEGVLLDVLDFIPKTSRNEQHRNRNQTLGSLDNLERWFAGRIENGNRNNQMIKYALCLVDTGMNLTDVRNAVFSFNGKLQDPLANQEIDGSIMVTVAKRFQQRP
jgi:hypothetical protein